MISRYNLPMALFFCWMLTAMPYVQAATIHVQVKGPNYTSTTNSEGEVPNVWVQAPNLQPVDKWIPGGLTNTPRDVTIRVSNGSKTVNIDVTLKGIEYFIDPSVFTTEAATGVTICPTVKQNGFARYLEGGKCYDRSVFVSKNGTIDPFNLVRPVLEIDESALIEAFKNASAPEGTYRGSVVVNYTFIGYKGGVKAARYISFPLELVVDYQPTYITSVNLPNVAEITPDYEKNTGRVELFGSVSGAFVNGLSISLLSVGEKSDYTLKSESHLSEIPYNVSCVTCSPTQLVEDGAVKNMKVVAGAGIESAMLSFTLLIDYNNLDLSTIDGGNYSDSFILMFEANL